MAKINLSQQLRNRYFIKEVIGTLRDKNLEPPKDFPLSLIETHPSYFNWTPPRRVQIPKSNGGLRDIFIFDEQCSFLLKIINTIFVENFGNQINSDVFSYRKGKRCFNAVDNIRKRLQEGSLVGYKFDIKNYFPSVDKETIFNSINELVVEEDSEGRDLLYSLFSLNCFIDSKTNKLVNQYLGLMPGSALSSFFANYVLHDLDDYLQNNAEVYSRYADDIVIFANNKREISELVNTTSLFLESKGLRIHPEKQEFLEKGKPFEFLGLSLDKNIIDMSKGTFQNLKKVVASVCKSSRRKVTPDTNLEYHLSNTIKHLNNLLYNGIFSASEAHKGSRMNYVFSNITTDRTLKLFDFYILDSLNYVVTGAHNNSPKRWSTKKFEVLGFRSCVQLWHLYKMNINIYKNEIYKLNKNPLREYKFVPRREQIPLNPTNRRTVTLNWKWSFSDLFYKILEDSNAFFLIDGNQVFPEFLTFDIQGHRLWFQDTIIIQDGKLQLDSLTVYLNGIWLNLNMSSPYNISSLPKESSDKLLERFIPASYNMDFSGKLERARSGFTQINLWRTWSFQDLISQFPEKLLDLYVPVQIRKIKFISYLWFHLVSGVLWSGLDYNKKFILVGDKKFNLILNKDWL